MAAKGLPAIYVIFHPTYTPDFNFSCEGLGSWHGQPAWQVRFEQRADRPSHIHQWKTLKRTIPTMLKGRAWVSTGSYRVLRIETDLLGPVEELQLASHHMAIDYSPIRSRDGKTELWLPASADVDSRLRGRFLHQRQ